MFYEAIQMVLFAIPNKNVNRRKAQSETSVAVTTQGFFVRNEGRLKDWGNEICVWWKKWCKDSNNGLPNKGNRTKLNI